VSDSPESAAALFPLALQSRWHYEVDVSRSGGVTQTLSAVKYFRDSVEVAGKRYFRLATDVSGGALRVPNQLVRSAEEGVYTAVQGADGKELLVLPADPGTTKSWCGEAPPAITRFVGEATTDQTFEHGSLKFDRCVKVTLNMMVREISLLGRQRTIAVRMERWFAPGVGMVREVRIVGEEGKPEFLRTECRLTRLATGEQPQ